MLRVIVATVALALLVPPAMGYEVVWDGVAVGDIQIDLQIDCYIQIVRDDVNHDPAITWTDQTPYDWYSPTLSGAAYSRCPDPNDDNQHPMWPWAGDDWYAGAGGSYYETDDGAEIYVASNNALTMTVHTNGDLTSGPNTLPTWFTVAMCPFVDGGNVVQGHNIPFGGCLGCYLGDSGAPQPNGVFSRCVPAENFPNQQRFACAPASNSWSISMLPELYGTINFLGTVNRHGMADPGGNYHTWLDVDFTSP